VVKIESSLSSPSAALSTTGLSSGEAVPGKLVALSKRSPKLADELACFARLISFFFIDLPGSFTVELPVD
jgi:hypothetical protein